jgi:hypothetical protein
MIMKKITLVLVVLLGSFSLKAQAPDQNLPEGMEDLQQTLEEMFKSFGGMFGDSTFNYMDTTFMKSFEMPFGEENMPFDTSFFRSFAIPFDGQSMPFGNEELFEGMQEMMDSFLKNFMEMEGMEEWDQERAPRSEPEGKPELEKPMPAKQKKKRKKYIL